MDCTSALWPDGAKLAVIVKDAALVPGEIAPMHPKPKVTSRSEFKEDITADIYPYQYWKSNLSVLEPDSDPSIESTEITDIHEWQRSSKFDYSDNKINCDYTRGSGENLDPQPISMEQIRNVNQIQTATV